MTSPNTKQIHAASRESDRQCHADQPHDGLAFVPLGCEPTHLPGIDPQANGGVSGLQEQSSRSYKEQECEQARHADISAIFKPVNSCNRHANSTCSEQCNAAGKSETARAGDFHSRSHSVRATNSDVETLIKTVAHNPDWNLPPDEAAEFESVLRSMEAHK